MAIVADPSTDTWHETMGLSTAKQLRETQTALAASQQDLTHVERQLREAQAERLVAEARLHDALGDVDALTLLNAELKAEAADFRAANERNLERLDRTQREVARANHRNRILAAENEAALRRLNEQRFQLAATVEFASAYQPGERDWQVADRDTGITCSSCTGPIVRGQAFQPLADAKGFFAHAACPLKETS